MGIQQEWIVGDIKDCVGVVTDALPDMLAAIDAHPFASLIIAVCVMRWRPDDKGR